MATFNLYKQDHFQCLFCVNNIWICDINLFCNNNKKEYYVNDNLLIFFISVTSLVASIMSLMLIACDRFFGIVYAMKAHVIERRAYHSIILIWFFSIAAGTPMLVKKKVFTREWLDYTEMWCDDEWELKPLGGGTDKFRPGRMAYYTIITFILYFIPLIVMAVAYCCVIKTLWTSKAPGERTTKDVNIQTKVKRKVTQFPLGFIQC